ncbi:hypothetical protein SAMN05421819_1995 [Bryocella elongata]|uniref:Lipocalin-like domain-containing protein n=2 Tax=Bryocella elongata TaxID=863522 RepID=A0A1H5XWH5_9BACT|nr:hypothetical protein SAMN05421819_1995 [Bryocella elongata]
MNPNTTRTSILSLAIGAFLGLLTASPAFAADPRIGAWTLVSADSTLTPPDKLTIVSTKEMVHVIMTGETHLDFTTQANGKQSPVAANPAFDQVQLHRINRKQVEVIEKKNGTVVSTIRNGLSKDGSELTLTTSRPGHPDQISVWTRAKAAKQAPDPFAGDWTQDVSKTRMRQGMTLTISAVGGDGVHFEGDYSYTAHFDGKPYDLRNSRNDTVQLAQPDAHTVDATYRRDQQPTQKDRWAVTPDGRTMTVTSTGSLETGQHFTEKLVFQKK